MCYVCLAQIYFKFNRIIIGYSTNDYGNGACHSVHSFILLIFYHLSLTGKYRHHAVTGREIEDIARHIDQEKAHALCKALVVGVTAMDNSGNTIPTYDLPIRDIILKWTRELRHIEIPPEDLSDALLKAGCYEFAWEVMTGKACTIEINANKRCFKKITSLEAQGMVHNRKSNAISMAYVHVHHNRN